jgi:membrane-bound lytic murein transglycosylase B
MMDTAKRLVGPCLVCLVIVILILDGHVTHAGDGEGFAQWLKGVRSDALAAGISAETLDQVFSGLQPRSEVLAADRSQPEFKRTLEEYLDRRINEQRVTEGRELLKKHRRLFGRLAVRYKVPPRILVALWGIETSYGRHQGKLPVIQSLATLAFDGRREDYFRRELLEALQILDDGLIPADRLQGSWAGAMGQLQFMPSTYRRYAVDLSGDGRSDIFDDPADALASAANYLAGSGWATDQTWGREVRLPQAFDRRLLGLEQQKTLRDWQQLGVRKSDGKRLPRAAMQGSLIQPDGPDGRAFLVYQNYRMLLTWNRSHNFAIAVGLLADRIVEKGK